MKRLLLALVLVVAAAAIFLGPPLRAAFAATNVDIVIGRAELHPTAQALAFMLLGLAAWRTRSGISRWKPLRFIATASSH